MKQDWFEMKDERRRKLARAVWIPLRAVHHPKKRGTFGHVGYIDDFYGVGTLAVPIDYKVEAEHLAWMDIGVSHHHAGHFQDDSYVSADVFADYGVTFSGVHLVLNQRGNSVEHAQWHLHQDFVTTLGLKQEGDVWVRPDEDYLRVAQLKRSADGAPSLLEVRASHLRDYLCARGMALYVTSFRQRDEIVEDVGHISWPKDGIEEKKDRDRWQGRVVTIHEGGEIFGSEWTVFHACRTDIDLEEDVPVMEPPSDENIQSTQWTTRNSGRKLFRIMGELWRTEWVDSAAASPIVRRDEIAPTVFFIVDAEGNKESRETLTESSQWLWFSPEVICALAERRGGSLAWYTRDTGRVGGSPDGKVDFGVNGLGLINVFAKDIAMLEEWEQGVWAGFNISPDGKLSQELHAAQVRVMPAATQAPEDFLSKGLAILQEVTHAKLGIKLFRPHEDVPKILARTHRFRAIDKHGLYALAKDVARLTADDIDAAQLHSIVAPPSNVKPWGSLKSLEKVLATKIPPEEARALLTPLVGIYDLRLADAHLPSTAIKDAIALVRIDESAPFVLQGLQLLDTCVTSIYRIAAVIKAWDKLGGKGQGTGAKP